MIHYQIIPDNQIDNNQVETLARSFTGYQSLFSRWDKSTKHFTKHPFLSLETILQPNKTAFYLTAKKENDLIAAKAIESTFPKATIKKVEDPFSADPLHIIELSYYHHYFLSLRVDKRSNALISNLLDVLPLLSDEERVDLQILAFPAADDFNSGADEAYRKFRAGELPKKIRLDKKYIGDTILNLAAKTSLAAVDALVSLTGGEPEKVNLDDKELSHILRDGRLRNETYTKAQGEAFSVTIRAGIHAKDQKRAEAIARMVYSAFRSLDGDNYLIYRSINREAGKKRLKERSESIKTQKDYMSLQELSRLYLMPTAHLQEKYKIQNVSSIETKLPERLLKGGILLGNHVIKGERQNVYFPLNDIDELCLPRLVVGGMGSGKSTFGTNFAVQAAKNGFGSVFVDPAKGIVGDEIEKLLPPEQVKRIRIGHKPISLDWREVRHAKNWKGRLANTVLSFFENAVEETGGQTSRFIRAACYAMTTGRLSEVFSILTDQKQREEAISRLSDGIHKMTLTDLNNHSEGRRRQILEPILNRFDSILGDEFLAECFNASEGLDLVALMSSGKTVVIDVPKAIVGTEGVELICNLLTTKIDLAMSLRKEKDQKPVFVILDEPHQYSKCSRIWKSAAVESRKWRVSYIWLFHEWKQIDGDLRDIIKSALPHYHIYSSSRKTYQDLSQELLPLTLEDCMKVKRRYAINLLRSGGENIKPFVAKMNYPFDKDPE